METALSHSQLVGQLTKSGFTPKEFVLLLGKRSFLKQGPYGRNRFLVTVQDTDNTDTDPAERATVEVTLTSAPSLTAPGGNGSDTMTISGNVD